jgi:hypothetical protein
MSDTHAMSKTASSSRFVRYSLLGMFGVVAYVLSSGPVLATAFWLREWTHRDGFYAVMWLYWPLLSLGRSPLLGHLLGQYVTWWCRWFGVTGPG